MKKKTNVVKQSNKQEVHVKVHVGDTSKKKKVYKKKASKKEGSSGGGGGSSSYNPGFTPVYIMSGYPVGVPNHTVDSVENIKQMQKQEVGHPLYESVKRDRNLVKSNVVPSPHVEQMLSKGVATGYDSDSDNELPNNQTYVSGYDPELIATATPVKELATVTTVRKGRGLSKSTIDYLINGGQPKTDTQREWLKNYNV